PRFRRTFRRGCSPSGRSTRRPNRCWSLTRDGSPSTTRVRSWPSWRAVDCGYGCGTATRPGRYRWFCASGVRRRWSDPGTWRKLCDSGRPRRWPELVISPQPWLVRLVAVVYVVSVALAVIAAAVCGFVGFRVLRLLRTCRVTASMVAARTNDRVGLLRARSAAVRVAITERRRHRGDNATPQYDRP